MATFLEERLPENIDYGSDFASSYQVYITQTAGGNEYRSQMNPFIKASMNIEFERQTNFIVEQVIDLNNRAGGKLRGFRVMHPVDFSTNNYRDTPTFNDQPMILANPAVPGVYQIVEWFGGYGGDSSRRHIYKPVAGSVLVGVGGASYPAAQWSVNNTTGIVTLAANKTGSITAISQASSAVVTATNTLVVGESLIISGVAGMTQINGVRAVVTARTGSQFTLNINSSLFTAYTSGGVFNTRPQAGEAVTAGCLFDIPMRFNADLGGNFSNWDTISANGLQIVEILNPFD